MGKISSAKEGPCFRGSRPLLQYSPVINPGSLFYVYCIVSGKDPTRRYVGYTEDPRQTVVDHNRSCNRSTVASRPWRLKGYIAFDNKGAALAFEAYLKTGSGHAFAKKRLW